jgi:DNA-binding transcriptional LysR family regulator
MTFDLRQLRYFIAVAEELNFTRAAERVHIAQPPLSQQIRSLEESLGVMLLQRTRRRVELTDAGRVFLEQARNIIRATDLAAVEAQRAQRGEIGRLAVGFFEHMSYTLLPPTLRAFRERYPRVDIQLRWFPVIDQADALRRGEVDISFMRRVPDMRDVRTEVVFEDRFVLAIPDTHSLAGQRDIALKQCASEPFVMFVPQVAPDFHAMITRLCTVAGFVPKVALEVGQVYTALGLVSSGAGIAFVPASVQRVHFDHVAYRPLRGRTQTFEVMLGHKQSAMSSVGAAFSETVRKVAGKM